MFYNTEIELRKQLKYPPFCDIIVVGFSGTDEREIIQLSSLVQKMLKNNVTKYGIEVYNAMPAPIDKIQNKYRWRIVAKGNINEDVTIIINKILKQIYDSNKYRKTNVVVDINPNNMM